MSLLKQGDFVATVCVLISDARAHSLPRGVVGHLGRVLCTKVEDEEEIPVFDFVPENYPGSWAVTEYEVRLLDRD